MGLASHALALGIGYVLGQPAGRERVRKVPEQVRQLAARPEAVRLTEKGKALTGQAVQTTKQRLGRSDASGAGGPAAGGSPTAGDTKRIEDAVRRRRLFVRPRRRPGGIDTPTSAAPGVILAESSGDPATDAAMHGTLPPAGKPAP